MTDRPLWTLRGVVETTPERVRALLFALNPGPVTEDNGFFLLGEGGEQGMTLRGGPDDFQCVVDGYALSVRADRAAGTLSVSGQWWYQGVYRVGPHPSGALVTYEVCNRSTLPDLVVRGWQASMRREQRRGAAQRFARLGGRLGCAAHPLPDGA
ncbi:hypothetical protein GCM10010399_45010 [Dactylosporangium fulvum]|uniref:Uncharacterized protein n=1 Tax=Dactylosporangium fulvum TaxID=53359 RepID=A0ABY5W8B3_9ACTN|nr:hypothetical protein [Dactylosporangium fulvum]UWP86117.1 hypothetical protein Dfulv_18480 [Dactylosporangium fulvum]